MQAGESRVIAQVDLVRAIVEHIDRSTLMFPVDFD